MDPNKNYYNVLGLDKNVTKEQLKKSYKKLAIIHHPDKGGDENKFKAISEAYSILSDDTKKLQYDTMSPHGKTYNPHKGFGGFGGGFHFGTNIEDIFNAFGGNAQGFGSTHQYQEFRENLDININAIISLRDVYKGNPLKVEYKRYKHCKDCDGTGFDRTSESDICEMCEGRGHNFLGGKCKYCQGTGKIHTGTCKSCNGEKVVISDETFNLNNIHMIRRSGTELLRGYGHQSKYFREKSGTVNLSIIYEHIPNYEITKDDKLIYNLDLHYDDAINGTKYRYEHLDGKTFYVSIPKKTKDKDLVKIKEKGLLRDIDNRNDLYFKINVIIDYEKIQTK